MFDNNIQTYFTYHPVTRLKCTLTEFSCIYSYINLIAINFRTFHHPQTLYPSNSKPSHSQKTSTLCLALAGLDIHINRILGSLSCLLSPRTIILLSVHGFVPMFHAYYGQIIFHHVSNTGFCLSIQVIRELFPVWSSDEQCCYEYLCTSSFVSLGCTYTSNSQILWQFYVYLWEELLILFPKVPAPLPIPTSGIQRSRFLLFLSSKCYFHSDSFLNYSCCGLCVECSPRGSCIEDLAPQPVDPVIEGTNGSWGLWCHQWLVLRQTPNIRTLLEHSRKENGN